jgi:hypothetical protein
MARVLYGSEITALKGSIGGITFHRNSSGNIARGKSHQINRRTALQYDAKVLFSQVRSSWSALSMANQALWNAFAVAHTKSNYFGEIKTLTGYNWFLSVNSNALLTGNSLLSAPPGYVLPTSPSVFSVICSSSELIVNFSTPDDHTSAYLFVYATPPTRGSSVVDRRNLRLITILAPGTLQSYDIKSAYLAAFGITAMPSSLDETAKVLVSISKVSSTSFIATAFTSSLANINVFTLFTIGTGFNGYVMCIGVQSTGKLIVVGLFSSYNGTDCNCICRLNTNGSLDTSFVIGTGPDLPIYGLLINSDDSLFIYGQFHQYDGHWAYHIALIADDGGYVTAFDSTIGANADIVNACAGPASSIYVVGYFTTWGGASHVKIVQLELDGTVTPSWSSGTGFNSNVSFIKWLATGYLYACGSFTAYDSNPALSIIRLYDDGTYDDTFDSSSGFNAAVESFCVDSSENVYCVGGFTAYGANPCAHAAKVNSLGIFQSSFNIGTGFNSIPLYINFDYIGRLLVCGYFTAYNGTSVKYSVRVFVTGAIDASYQQLVVFNDVIYRLAFNAYNSIFLVGGFTSSGVPTYNRICKLTYLGQSATTH